jgi:hypothetical protein
MTTPRAPLGAERIAEIRGPIPLNEAQEQAAKDWAADDRLWTTQETVEFNLRTFARVILKAAYTTLQAEVEAREQAAQQTNEATIQRLLADPVRQECDSLKEQRDTWHANYLAAEQLRQSAEAVAFQDRKRAETAEQALEAAEQKIKSLTARAIVAEQHKTLELLSKGSATEQLEMRLREKLAAAELRAEAAEQRITALEGALRAKVQEWRTQIHHETPPLNAIQAGSWDTKRQCADELDALLTPSAGSPDSKRSTE